MNKIKDRPQTPRSKTTTPNPVYRVTQDCECIFADGRRSAWVQKGTLLSLLGCRLTTRNDSYFMYDNYPILVPHAAIEHVWGNLGPRDKETK